MNFRFAAGRLRRHRPPPPHPSPPAAYAGALPTVVDASDRPPVDASVGSYATASDAAVAPAAATAAAAAATTPVRIPGSLFGGIAVVGHPGAAAYDAVYVREVDMCREANGWVPTHRLRPTIGPGAAEAAAARTPVRPGEAWEARVAGVMATAYDRQCGVANRNELLVCSSVGGGDGEGDDNGDDGTGPPAVTIHWDAGAGDPPSWPRTMVAIPPDQSLVCRGGVAPAGRPTTTAAGAGPAGAAGAATGGGNGRRGAVEEAAASTPAAPAPHHFVTFRLVVKELDEVAVVKSITSDAVESAAALTRLVPSGGAGVGVRSLLRMVGSATQAGLDAIGRPDDVLDVHPTFVVLPPPLLPPPPPPPPPPRRVTLWELPDFTAAAPERETDGGAAESASSVSLSNESIESVSPPSLYEGPVAKPRPPSMTGTVAAEAAAPPPPPLCEPLSYGWYFFLSAATPACLYVQTGTSGVPRLFTRRVSKRGRAPESQFQPLTHLSYLVLRVSGPTQSPRRIAPAVAAATAAAAAARLAVVGVRGFDRPTPPPPSADSGEKALEVLTCLADLLLKAQRGRGSAPPTPAVPPAPPSVAVAAPPSAPSAPSARAWDWRARDRHSAAAAAEESSSVEGAETGRGGRTPARLARALARVAGTTADDAAASALEASSADWAPPSAPATLPMQVGAGRAASRSAAAAESDGSLEEEGADAVEHDGRAAAWMAHALRRAAGKLTCDAAPSASEAASAAAALAAADGANPVGLCGADSRFEPPCARAAPSPADGAPPAACEDVELAGSAPPWARAAPLPAGDAPPPAPDTSALASVALPSAPAAPSPAGAAPPPPCGDLALAHDASAPLSNDWDLGGGHPPPDRDDRALACGDVGLASDEPPPTPGTSALALATAPPARAVPSAAGEAPPPPYDDRSLACDASSPVSSDWAWACAQPPPDGDDRALAGGDIGLAWDEPPPASDEPSPEE